MKCLTCDNKAFYELTGYVKGQVFCKSHLPWTVSLKKDLGSKVLVIEEPNIPVVALPIPFSTVELVGTNILLRGLRPFMIFSPMLLRSSPGVCLICVSDPVRILVALTTFCIVLPRSPFSMLLKMLLPAQINPPRFLNGLDTLS